MPGEFPGINSKSRLPNGDLWQGVCNRPIPFSKEVARIIFIEVDKALRSHDPLVYIVPDNIEDCLRAEIKRFIVALAAYFASPNPVISLKIILDGILNEGFADYLKKVRTKCLIFKAGGLHDADPGPDYEKLPVYIIKDIGDVFNYKYWINWKIDLDDSLEYHQIPVKVNEGSAILFEEACIKLLEAVREKNRVPVVTKDSILSTLSSSSCITAGGKKSKVWKEKEKTRSFSSSPLIGYVSPVQKGPTELRMAVTLKVDQSNSVKLIDKQIYYIVRNMKYSAYNSSNEVFEDRLKTYYDNNTSFFNRDLTKEGITKPRQLIKIMARCLKKVFPDLPAWDHLGIYDNYHYIDEEGLLNSTERGHGLGMGNALTTLMQCSAFAAFLEQADVDSSTVDALFFNDDATIAAEDPETLDVIQDEESDFLESLGLLPKGSKTWKGRVAILCERYYPDLLNTKASYKNYARVIPFSASCILTAKSMSNLTLDPAYGDPRWDLFERLTVFFGTESGDPEEITTPYCAGGWMNIRYAGVDCSFLDYEDKPPGAFLSNGALIGAPKLKPELYSKELGLYKSPAEYLYKFPEIPEVVAKRIMIKRTRAEVAAMFSRNNDEEHLRYWLMSQVKKRRKQWCNKAPYLSWKEVIMKVSEASSNDFLPPRFYIKQVDNLDVSVGGSGRFEPDDPLLSVLRFYESEMPSPCRTVPWPVYDPGEGADITSSKIQQSESKNMFLPRGHPILNRSPYVNDRVLLRRCWKNSYNVWKVWMALTGNPTFPINPWPVGEALLHQEFQDYEAHVETHWDWYKYTGLVGYKTLQLLIKNPDIADQLLEAEVSPKAEPVVVEETPPGPESFQDWYWGGRPKSNHSLIHLWEKGAECIQDSLTLEANLDIIGADSGLTLPSYKFESEIIENLTLLLCGIERTEKAGYIVYHFHSPPGLWSDSEEGFADIFDGG